MVYIYTCIFILTMAAGAGYAWLGEFTPVQWVVCLTISGFLGSSIVALIFTFFFFFRRENEQEKIQRLQDEIVQLKQQKQLKRLE
ncbi:MAG: hypothetical protein MI747_14825 [Desulfobacterales bacterium]|nr:hypothetical protein [Desulfobacterales bacterium]